MQPGSKSGLKDWGMGALFLIGLVVMFILALLMVRGMVWASEKVLPWLVVASLYATGVCVFVLLPLCIFRRTRPWAGVAFGWISYLFGTMLFAYSCLFVVYAWGYGALFFGLVFAGVGVVPVALLAGLFHAEWHVLLELGVGIFLTFGTRYFGMRLTEIRPTPEEQRLSDLYE